MTSFSGILKKLFGSKAERDLKQIKPILEKTLEAYKRIDILSDDDLREEARKIRKVIADKIADNEAKKKELRNRLEDMTLSPDEKEDVATEVDKLAKKIDEQIEEVLLEVLPDAFSVMKSTARRFKENATIKVLATEE
ncbi:MAG: preprotein translocase subunit SecA, partial [Bacteroidales bacterium]